MNVELRMKFQIGFKFQDHQRRFARIIFKLKLKNNLYKFLCAFKSG